MSHTFNGRCAATGDYALCAGTKGPSYNTSYKDVKWGNDGAFLYIRRLDSADFRDGLSNTIFVGEVQESDSLNSPLVWSLAYRHSNPRTTENALNTLPGEGSCLDMYGRRLNGAFGSKHPGGAHFAFGDGHVSFLSENVDLRSYQALSTRFGRDRPEGLEF